MDRRLLLGGAGIVLVAALVGVLALTGDEVEDQPLVYDVSWPVEPGPSTTRSDRLQEGRNETYNLELDRPNVTGVTVRLDWTDDVGRPDRFRLEATPPGGSTISNESENGSIRFDFDIGSPPSVPNVTADNRSDARSRAAAEATDDGQGTWRVRVSLVAAPGRQPVSQAPQVETMPDGANSYNLTFAHTSFRADIGDPGPPPG